jgi:hypothetical protein
MIMHRFRRAAVASLLALLLGACTAPAPQANANAAQESAPAPAAEPASASPRDDAQSRRPAKPPRMSDPLPPQRVPREPLTIDRSCRSDADCAVKDVGSCCGYQPACVNRDSPTDPAAVRAQCEAQGMASICGFREIAACTCNAGQCEAVGADAPVAQ